MTFDPADYPARHQMLRLNDEAEKAFEEIVHQQRLKVYAAARRLVPHITDEDLRDPHSFPALSGDAAWNYEDGYLAGLIAAQVSLRRKVLVPLTEGRAPEEAILPPDSKFRREKRDRAPRA